MFYKKKATSWSPPKSVVAQREQIRSPVRN